MEAVSEWVEFFANHGKRELPMKLGDSEAKMVPLETVYQMFMARMLAEAKASNGDLLAQSMVSAREG